MKPGLRITGLIGLFLLSAMVALSPWPLHAQTFYGSIVGTVTDTSDAAIPGAAVTITNVSTNEKHTAQSDSVGNYEFVNLVPAVYKVEVQKANFKRFLRDQAVVEVNSTLRVDAALQVGAATETVEVTAQSPLLQTDSGTLGTVVEGATITEMPLNGRNTMSLIALAPGVIPGGSTSGAIALNQNGNSQNLGWGNYQIGGGIAGQSTIYIDGAPNNNLNGNSVGFVPTQDAVQEFNVATNDVSPEYGRFAGGVVNMTTKSGTNAFHGSAYEYLRNNKLNANDWFSNNLGKARPEWDQNQYGVVFDGPIKKDKVFFLFSWEAFVARTGTLAQSTTPTSDMQKGVIDGANLFTSYPALSTLCPTASYSATTNATTIPSGCWDPVGAILASNYPAPNNSVGLYNFITDYSSGSNVGEYNGRVDYTISAKQRFFSRYSYMRVDDLAYNTMPGGTYKGFVWNLSAAAPHMRTQNGVLGDTYTFNPATILDVRLSYMKAYDSRWSPLVGMNMSIYGGEYPTLAPQLTFTDVVLFTLTGSLGLSGWHGIGGMYQNADTSALSASLTRIVGNHSLKFGGEARLMDQSTLNAGGTVSFTFSNQYFTGNEWANLLLGLANSGSVGTNRYTDAFNWYQGYYVSDSWQARRKLTLTLGLRWELAGNIKEKKDRAGVLLPNVTDSVTGAYGTFALVNTPLYPDRGSEPARHDLFSPRVGFAYRLTTNNVIRGGYAYELVAPDLQAGMFPQTASINAASTSWSAPNTVYSLSYPFPTSAYPNGINQPTGRAGFTTTQYLEQRISGPVPSLRYPYTEEWNLSVSHQFKGDWMTEIGYAGSAGTHLPVSSFSLNELNSQHWADQTMPLSNAATCGSSTQVVWAPGKTTNGQCDRPHPAYTSFGDTVANYGSTNFHSLQARLEKRLRPGGVVTVAYTFDKFIGNVDNTFAPVEGSGFSESWQDYNNPRGERSLSASDVPQRLVASYVLNLPFGKGQRYLANVNGVASRLVSGWSVNGITTFQSGNPLQIAAAEPSGVTNIPTTYGAGSLRANYTAGCTKTMPGSAISRVNEWFNTSCFTAPPVAYSIGTKNYATTLGNEPREDSQLRSQGIDNWDFSAQKVTKITERTSLEFRFEFFNLFNRVRLNYPSLSLNGKNFGVISTQLNNPRQGQASLRFTF